MHGNKKTAAVDFFQHYFPFTPNLLRNYIIKQNLFHGNEINTSAFQFLYFFDTYN